MVDAGHDSRLRVILFCLLFGEPLLYLGPGALVVSLLYRRAGSDFMLDWVSVQVCHVGQGFVKWDRGLSSGTGVSVQVCVRIKILSS